MTTPTDSPNQHKCIVVYGDDVPKPLPRPIINGLGLDWSDITRFGDTRKRDAWEMRFLMIPVCRTSVKQRVTCAAYIDRLARSMFQRGELRILKLGDGGGFDELSIGDTGLVYWALGGGGRGSWREDTRIPAPDG